MAQLQRIELSGFKSIDRLDLELRSLNVMIGENGAGKSNLVLFFQMLNEIIGQRLQQFIGTSGRAHSLLRYGPKKTQQIHSRLTFDVAGCNNTYDMRLADAAVDTLIFAEESLEVRQKTCANDSKRIEFGAGHRETAIKKVAEKGNPAAGELYNLLNNCKVYQFHDTSPTANIRDYCYIDDNRVLLPDAGNLAAVLYKLRNSDNPKAYRRIVGTIRQIAPYFEDFDLEPNGAESRDLALNWREKNSDQLFGPHLLSDGTLRAMALFTLLLQPTSDLPDVMVIDEPELGLHPFAKNILVSLMKKASCHCQIIAATQSAALIDGFDAEDILVVERGESGSVFERQNADKLKDWLEKYTLGELWEKNVLGGGPA